MKHRRKKKREISEIQFFIREKMLTIFGWNFEIWAVQKYVNLVDLVKSFQTSIYYLLAKIDFDTAENEPLKDCQQLANSWKKQFEQP